MLLGVTPGLAADSTPTLATPLNRYYDSLSALEQALPDRADVSYGDQLYPQQEIVWEQVSGDLHLGDYTVTGTISGGELDGKTIDQTVTIADSRTVYFFDCGAETSSYFDQVAEAAPGLKNEQPDPAYTQGGSGYIGTVGDEGTIKFHAGDDLFETGIYAMNGGDIIYQMDDLEAGCYTITTGYQEWWAQWTDHRGMRLVVRDEAGTTLAYDDITLYDDDQYQQVQFFLTDTQDVTVTIEKTGGADQVLSFLSVAKTGELPQEETDEDLKASFHLISDVHVSSKDSDSALSYVQGMRFMDLLNPSTNIAFVNAGDFTNNSQESEYQAFYELTAQYNPSSQEQTLIIQGNHDVRGNRNWCEDPKGEFPDWETYKGYYQEYNADYMPESAQDTLYHSKELGGYTFLMLNTELGLKDAMYMSDQQLEWIEAQMKASYEKDPNKPVFIVCHQALNDTHVRSNVLNGFDGINTDGTPNGNYTGSDAKVKEIMEKYPVGVFLSGHIHNGLGYGEVIAREYGICVDLPAFGGSENGYLETGSGYEVLIYEDSIQFQAYNFATGQRLEEYDQVVEFPTVSALYQEASQAVEDTQTSSEQRTALQEAMEETQPLLNRVYDQSDRAWDDGSEPDEFLYHADTWEDINGAAQQLRDALNMVDTYTVTFMSNGVLYTTETVEEGQPVAQPEAPQLEGYTFGGWYTDEDCTQVYDFDTGVTADVTLYAKWTPNQSANKSLLQTTYDYALAQDTSDLIPTVAEFYQKALDQAKAVLDNPAATQTEVDDAWTNLTKAVHMLSFTRGDKAMLELLITRAEGMVENVDKYMADNWQQLVDALAEAKDVFADENAMDGDIQPVEEELLNAILAQRYKADKSILEDLIGKAQGINLEGYTAESVATFRTALQNARAVMADETLSEDDQAVVNEAVAQLTAAMDGLTAGGAPETTDKPEASQAPEATDKPQNTEKPQATQKPENNVPQTGDQSLLLVYVAILASAVLLLSTAVVVRKQTRR